MALGSHLITVRRLEKYINDVIGKKANLPDTSKTIIGNISQINSDLLDNIKKTTKNTEDIETIAGAQIPQSTVANAVNNYVSEHSAGFATKTELNEICFDENGVSTNVLTRDDIQLAYCTRENNIFTNTQQENMRVGITIPYRPIRLKVNTSSDVGCLFVIVAYDNNNNQVGNIIYKGITKNVDFFYDLNNLPENVSKVWIQIQYSSSGITTTATINTFKIYCLDNNFIKLYSLIENKAHYKILTLIDDDNSYDGMTNIKNVCDELGVKCTFGCISKSMEERHITKATDYQKLGFHITNHSGTHSGWYGSNKQSYQWIESDLIDARTFFESHTFLDSEAFIYPGDSSNDSKIRTIVKKWCKCGVNAIGGAVNGYDVDRYNINRRFIIKGNTLDFYKNEIDSVQDNASWLVYGTHSGDTNTTDFALVKNVIQYAISKGYVVMTLNEALKYVNFGE